MKKYITTFVLTIILVIASTGKDQAQKTYENSGKVEKTDSLVASYPFNGNADDVSGNGNNGIVYGALPVADRFGTDSAAYSFDGVDDYIDIGGISPLDNPLDDKISISLWAKGSLSDYAKFIEFGTASTTNGLGSGIGAGSINSIDFRSRTTDHEYNPTSVSVNNDNNWHHYVLTLNDTIGFEVLKGYIDGVEVVSQVAGSNVGTGTSSGYIGKRPSGNYFNGIIDDVKIFHRTLSISEIIDFYANYHAPDTLMVESGHNDITLSWNFDTVIEPVKYYIYRDTATSLATLYDSIIVNSSADTTFIDANVEINKTYYYKIASVDSLGNVSQLSEEVTATVYELADGLVSYWKFDGDALDSYGTNNCTNYGATDTSGIINGAYRFDGVDDTLLTNYSFSDTNIISFSTWVYPMAIQDSTRIFGEEDDTDQTLMLLWDDDNSNSFIFKVGDSFVYYGNVALNNWYHIAGSYDGSSIRLYVNGDLVDQAIRTGNLYQSTNTLMFGTDSRGLGRFFNGIIDEPAIWNRVLTHPEIEVLYNTGIGNQYPFNAIVISTADVTNRTQTTATCGGNITGDGGSSISARGVVWDTLSNPTVVANVGISSDGSGIGAYTSELTGLEPGTMYYVRAYAINATDTTYGYEQSFYTILGTPNDPISDNDGNTYQTIQIGDQIWMAENFKGTTDKDGNPLTSYSYNNDDGNVETYGRLYDWTNAMAGAPEGWHLPTDEEWKQLEIFMGMSQQNADTTGFRGADEGNKLKEAGNAHWNSPGSGIDLLGFAALPAGYRDNTVYYDHLNIRSYFWSSTPIDATNSYFRELFSDSSNINRSGQLKGHAFSVRYIKDSEKSVQDIDGNVYDVVEIGTQKWTKQNLKTTTYKNGETITLETDPTNWSNNTTGAYCWYNNDQATYSDTYGALYNWYTVETYNICPDGWRVPSDYDWKQLEMYVGMDQVAADSTNWRGTIEGDKLKTTSGWSAGGNGTDEVGFAALPGGVRYETGTYSAVGSTAHFGTSTEFNTNTEWYRTITTDNSAIHRDNRLKKYGFSVRCVEGYALAELLNIYVDSIAFEGLQYSSGDTAQSAFVKNIGAESITVDSIVGLEPPFALTFASTTIAPGDSVELIVTLSTDTIVGNYTDTINIYREGQRIWLAVSASVTPIYADPVTDFNGNTYQTIQIGDQVWMAENFKGTNDKNGGALTSYIYNGNAGGELNTYGRLYTWDQAMKGAPEGWHLPTDAEWQQLELYMGMDQVAVDSIGWRGTIEGNKLKQTGNGLWQSPSEGTNDFGFGALPGGYYAGSYVQIGLNAEFWTSTESSSSEAKLRELHHDESRIYRSNGTSKSQAFSVRYVKNKETQFTDVEGNTYETVYIGNQIWMAENLKTKTYANGTAIPDGSAAGVLSYNNTSSYWFTYNNDLNYKDTLGLLYTWAAIMNGETSNDANPSGVQGVCPDGWHVPSDSEYKQLELFLGMPEGDVNQSGDQRGTTEGDLLKNPDTLFWNSPSTGNDSSGFNAMPAGYRALDGSYNDYRTNTYFWTVSNESPDFYWIRRLKSGSSKIDRSSFARANGYSVRCVKDFLLVDQIDLSMDSIEFLQIEFNSGDKTQAFFIRNLGQEEFTIDSIVGLDIPFSVTYGTNTIAAEDSIELTVSFDPNNVVGHYYDTLLIYGEGQQIQLPIYGRIAPIYGDPLTDTDGNTYQTVWIGDQLWMAENFKGTQDKDGNPLTTYSYGDNEDTVNIYGRLYTWEEALNGAPEGWHLATNEEWAQMESYIGAPVTGEQLKSIDDWYDNGNGTDAFGFDALPSGYRTDAGVYEYLQYFGKFWTSIELNGTTANAYVLSYINSEITLESRSKAFAYSVRYIKDTEKTVQDIEGNVYDVVVYGDQSWMKQNLKTITYKDGSSIDLITDNNLWLNHTIGAYSWYNNDESTYGANYGALYNWHSVQSGNICPVGWRVPTDNDWKELEIFLGMSIEDADSIGLRGENQGSQLANNAALWTDGTLESDSLFGNSGFDAYPGGLRNGNTGVFESFGTNGNWWSASEYTNNYSLNRNIGYNNTGITRNYVNNISGLSVRCIKGNTLTDNIEISVDSVDFDYIAYNSGDTLQTSFIRNLFTGDIVVDSLTGLDPPFDVWIINNTLSSGPVPAGDSVVLGIVFSPDTVVGFYYDTLKVHAQGQHLWIPVYGQIAPIYGDTLTDIDNNTYQTVWIGDQLWMAENFRGTRDKDGLSITSFDNDVKYGRLYRWIDAKKGAPEGWHLPTAQEIAQLEEYIGVETAGKMLKNVDDWASQGNGTDDFGFHGLPGGYRDLGSILDSVTYVGKFWTSNRNSSNIGTAYCLEYSNIGLRYENQNTNYAYSVRYIKDSDKTVQDVDGNIYDVVDIGFQSWMKQNLKTTKYKDETAITLREDSATWSSSNTEAYCLYNNDAANEYSYGLLYNYYAVESGNLCPDGWRVPLDNDWKELEILMGMNDGVVDNTAWRGTNQGSKLAGNNTLWTDGALESDADFGSSEFIALPGGYRDSTGNFINLALSSHFWSSSVNSGTDSWSREIAYNNTAVNRDVYNKRYGYSIRCIRGLPIAEVINITVDSIEFDSITFAYGDTIQSTIIENVSSDSVVVDSVGGLDFPFSISNGAKNTLVEINIPVGQSEEIQVTFHADSTVGLGHYFDTLNIYSQGQMVQIPVYARIAPIYGDPLTDYDGNTYQTVVIGDQVWMAENFKCENDNAGNPITNHPYGSNNVLYDWATARAAAPEGWHLPTDEEWKQLEMYLGMSRAQADATGWRGTDEAVKLKDLSTNGNDDFGFGALLGGYTPDGVSFSELNVNGYWWTSAEYTDGTNKWLRSFSIDSGTINRTIAPEGYAYSVRYVKNSDRIVQDVDNNVYDVVEIGHQKWMKQNLKTTQYKDKTSITLEENNANWAALSVGAYCWLGNDAAGNGATFGALYNWYAVSTGQLCPDGWRVPSDDDWKQLEMELGMSQTNSDLEGWRGTNQGSQLAGNDVMWSDGNLDTNVDFGTSGFYALPGGFRDNTGVYQDTGFVAGFWSSTENSSPEAWYRELSSANANINRTGIDKKYGYSIRCVKGLPLSDIIDVSVNNIDFNAIQYNFGDTIQSVFVKNIGLDSVVIDSISGLDFPFSMTFNGDTILLNDSSQINVTFHADSTVGIGYYYDTLKIYSQGQNKRVLISAQIEPVYGEDLIDNNNNSYTTVQIGDQLWMAENFKGTLDKDSVALTNYAYNNNSGNEVDTYGRLYDWENAKAGAPEGWHLPTDEEWKQLEMYLGMSQQAANNTGWRGVNQAIKLKDQSINGTNEYAFSALAGGWRSEAAAFADLNVKGYFWTSAPNTYDSAWIRTIGIDSVKIYRSINDKGNAYSVRYVKNSEKTVQDTDGNIYDVVEIGDQKWTKQNLKTTTYRDGTSIAQETDGTNWSELTSGAYCWYSNNELLYSSAYGVLYNWYTVETGDLCPDGWRVPTDKDWIQLEMYMGMDSATAYSTTWRGTDEGYKLKASDGWYSTGNGIDEVDFSVFPAGVRNETGVFDAEGQTTYFGTSTEVDESTHWYRTITWDNSAIHRYNRSKNIGFSVRCIKGQTLAENINISTDTIKFVNVHQSSNDTLRTAVIKNISAESIAIDSITGFDPPFNVSFEYFSKIGGPISSGDSAKINVVFNTDTVIGQYSDTLRVYGQGQVTTIPVYARIAPAYLDTLTDFDGNQYPTIQIGDQVWMAENFRGTHDKDGNELVSFIYGDDSATYYNTYGRLYNWVNAIEGAPEGWHLPTDEEWKQLEMYLGMSSNDADLTGWRGSYEGNKLKEEGNSHWLSPSNGSDYFAFTALPGGYRDNAGLYYQVTTYNYYWSSSETNNINVYNRVLANDQTGIGRNNIIKTNAYSVRYIKDSEKTVQDIDGNIYDVVEIGEQKWLKQNLKTTTYKEGTSIALVEDGTNWSNLTLDAYCWYNNEEATYGAVYGALYNWNAVASGNLCPDGWRVSTDDDWKQLELYLGMNPAIVDNTGYRGSNEGSKLAGNAGLWQTGNLEIDVEFGSTGFNGVPAGIRNSDGSYGQIDQYTAWYTTSAQADEISWIRHLVNSDTKVGRMAYDNHAGLSVRCIQGSTLTENIDVSADTVLFSHITYNTGDTTQSVFVKNISADTIAIENIGGLDYPFSVTFIENDTIFPGDSIQLSITFAPDTTVGYYFDAMNIYSLGQVASIQVASNISPVYGDTVVDINGNEYPTVFIGDQVWFGKNLKATSYNNGAAITYASSSAEWQTQAELGAYCYYNNYTDNYDTYGALYSWQTVASGNLCPDGWSVPTDADWKQLETYLGMSEATAEIEGWRGNNEGSQLAGGIDLWINGALLDDAEFGSTGFEALPGGWRDANGIYQYETLQSLYWSSSIYNADSTWGRAMIYSAENIRRFYDIKNSGMSVRCFRPVSYSDYLDISLDSVEFANIQQNSGDTTQTLYVKNNRLVNFTIDSVSLLNSPFGSSFEIIGKSGGMLAPGDSAVLNVSFAPDTAIGYYYDTIYLYSRDITIEIPVAGRIAPVYGDSLTDIDGNTYPTVWIGDQLWMAANFRGTTDKDGNPITSYAYNDSVEYVDKYGRLYDWDNALAGAPDGWHLPTDEEWKQLEMYLGMSEQDADGTGPRGTLEGNILKERGNEHWDSPSAGTNEYNFTGLPGGYRSYDGSGYLTEGTNAYWWTSTDAGSGNSMFRRLLFDNSQVTRNSNYKTYAFSVRYIKDSDKTVEDIDGNIYDVVKIGEQRWMKQNLKTTTYNNGTAISLVADSLSWINLTTEAYCWYNNDETTYSANYGALYNWYTVQTNHLCPIGWRVPTDDDWKLLEMNLGMDQASADAEGWRGTNEGSKLSGRADLWLDGVLETDLAFDSSGFSALPGGLRTPSATFEYLQNQGYWWTSTDYSPSYSFIRLINYNYSTVARTYYLDRYGASVRCVQVPVLTENIILSVDSLEFLNIGQNDGDTAQSVFIKNMGTDSVTIDNVSGLQPPFAATLIATKDGGIVPPGDSVELVVTFSPDTTLIFHYDTVDIYGYGEVLHVPVKGKAVGSPGDTITDIEGNSYSTVWIGNQNWMAENLRTTTYKDNYVIELAEADTEWQNNLAGAYCWYGNDSIAYVETYGALYNWYAVESRNVCPVGWHVPTDADWKTLEIQLGMTAAEANMDGWRGSNEGSKLAGRAELWSDGILETDIDFGNSKYMATPAGYRLNSGVFVGNGNVFTTWSSTKVDTFNAKTRGLSFDTTNIERGANNLNTGLPVRCVSGSLLSVSSTSVTNIASYNATFEGIILENGETEVVAHGVVWDSTPMPTLIENLGYSDNGAGTGVYSSEISGLESLHNYYARAFAVNETDTVYGRPVLFTTTDTYQVEFTVTDGIDSLSGATILVSDSTLTTDSVGYASVQLSPGSHPFEVEYDGCARYFDTLYVYTDPVYIDVEMERSYLVSFTITDTITKATSPIDSVVIQIDGHELITDTLGVASIELVNGDYEYIATKDGYVIYEDSVTVDSLPVSQTFELFETSANIEAVNGCDVGTVTVTSQFTGLQTIQLTDTLGNLLEEWTGEGNTYTFTSISTGYYRGKALQGNYFITTANDTLINTVTPDQPGEMAGLDTICAYTEQVYSVDLVEGVTYLWQLPTGWTGTSTSNEITVQVNSTSGTIVVTPEVDGCFGVSREFDVSVQEVPVQPTLEVGSFTLCSGTLETYQVDDQGADVEYEWIIPDGWEFQGDSTQNVVNVIVGTAGGAISVTPSTNYCTGDALVLGVSVNPTPGQPSPINGPDAPCVGIDTTYFVDYVDGVTYDWLLPSDWTINGSQIGNSINVSVGSLSGNVSVKLRISDCTGEESLLPVTPIPLPDPITEITGNYTVCENATESYSVEYQEDVTYDWVLPDGWTFVGDSTTHQITVSVNGVLDGTIYVTPSNANCEGGTFNQFIVVNSLPSIPSSIVGTYYPCEGSQALYSVTAVSNVKYDWNFPDDWTFNESDSSNSVTVVAGVQSGSIEVTPYKFGCVGTTRTKEGVNPSYTPESLSQIIGDDVVCEGDYETYRVEEDFDSVQFHWKVPATWIGGTSTENTIMPKVGSGSGEVKVIPFNMHNHKCYAPDTTRLYVTVNQLPEQPSEVEGLHKPCEYSETEYSVIEVEDVEYEWLLPEGWNFVDGVDTSSNSIQVIVGNNGDGSQNVLVTPSRNGCKGSSRSHWVEPKETNIPEIKTKWGGDVLICINSESIFTNYQWFKNDEIIEGAVSQYYVTDLEAGSYTVNAKNTNGCVGTSEPENVGSSKIEIYPNPVQEVVHINMSNEINGEYIITIINNMGEKVIEMEQHKNTFHYTFDIPVSYLKPGLYHVDINAPEGYSINKKFIKTE